MKQDLFRPIKKRSFNLLFVLDLDREFVGSNSTSRQHGVTSPPYLKDPDPQSDSAVQSEQLIHGLSEADR